MAQTARRGQVTSGAVRIKNAAQPLRAEHLLARIGAHALRAPVCDAP